MKCTSPLTLPPGSSPCTASRCRWTWRAGCGTCSAETARSSYSARRWACCGSTRTSWPAWTSSTWPSSSPACPTSSRPSSSSSTSHPCTWPAATGSGHRYYIIPFWILEVSGWCCIFFLYTLRFLHFCSLRSCRRYKKTRSEAAPCWSAEPNRTQ